MPSIKVLFSTIVLLLSGYSLLAQDNDYLKHRKFFDICSIKKQCAQCYTCNQERVMVKILNKSDKKITNVYYKFYSSVFNKIVEKDAKLQGDKIESKKTGYLYVCVNEISHWTISKIEYADGSTENFVLHDRLENFLQEPDECDCND